MTTWIPSPRPNESELSRNKTAYVQAKFGEGVKIDRGSFKNARKMNEAKSIVHSTTQQFPQGMQCNLMYFIFVHPLLDITGMTQLLDRDSVKIPEHFV